MILSKLMLQDQQSPETQRDFQGIEPGKAVQEYKGSLGTVVHRLAVQGKVQ